MKRVCFINGSPRRKNSGSQFLIEKTMEMLDNEKVISYNMHVSDFNEACEEYLRYDNLLHSDSIIFVFPLYVDSLPAALLDFLLKLEAYLLESRNTPAAEKLPSVFAVVNCGFFESEGNKYALQIIKHFCDKTGFLWRFGVAVGGGEFVRKPDNPIFLWMKKPVFHALSKLGLELENPGKDPLENIYVTPRMPVFVYNSVANAEWRNHILHS